MMRLPIAGTGKGKNDIVSGDISFGYYHFTLMVMDSIIEQRICGKITADFTDLGIIPALSNPCHCQRHILPNFRRFFHLRPRLSPVSECNFI